MHAYVVAKTWLAPNMVRVRLGGGTLDEFVMTDGTDAYINIALPPQGATYGFVFDPDEVKAAFPRESWPHRRRYSIRAWDADAREMDVDFVIHGDSGVAGPWAARAEVGDALTFAGPASGYRPSDDADWHLMLGDESALPAIAASLEVLPADATAVVRVVCDGPEFEIPIDAPHGSDVRWLHRVAGEPSPLAAEVRELQFPEGTVHAFVHGEADEIREVRKHLLGERGLSRQDMSCSPYWRQAMTDESWREVKRDFVAAMEADVT